MLCGASRLLHCHVQRRSPWERAAVYLKQQRLWTPTNHAVSPQPLPGLTPGHFSPWHLPAAQGPRAQQVRRAPPPPVSSLLLDDQKAPVQVPKPLMERTLAILEISHHRCCKFIITLLEPALKIEVPSPDQA